MIGKVLVSLGVLTVGVASVGLIVPDEARVERAIVIRAPKERIYALAADFHNWSAWAPIARPSAAVAIRGEGVGQILRWSDAAAPLPSGEQVLEGLMPQERVDMVWRYGPAQAGKASLAFEQSGDGVRAVWSFNTKMRSGVAVWRKPFAAYQALALRRQIGATYELGLESLKRAAEASETAIPSQSETL